MKNSLKILLFFGIFFSLLSCGKEPSTTSQTEENVPAVTETVSQPTEQTSSPQVEVVESVENTTAQTGQWTVYEDSGNIFGEIDQTKGPLAIFAEGQNLQTSSTSEIRKYTAGGQIRYEVKYRSEGFKLRNPQGELLWKIKIYPEKIKVSDNEENEDPWVIRAEGEGWKTSRMDHQLGTIAFDAGAQKMRISGENGVFTVPSLQESRAWGLLLIDDIPVLERMILIAELLEQP